MMIAKKRKYDALWWVLALALYAVFYFLVEEKVLPNFWRLQVVVIAINIIMAASLNLINGITGQFSLGHAGFMAVGAYVSAVGTVFYDWPFAVSLLAGGLAAAAIGFLIGIPTLRLDGDYLAIATLGMGEIIRVCILNIEAIGGASGMTGIPKETTFSWVFLMMLVTLYVLKNMINSTYGRGCISVELYVPEIVRLPHHGRAGRSRQYDGFGGRRGDADISHGGAFGLSGIPHDHLRADAHSLDDVPAAGPVRQPGTDLVPAEVGQGR